MSHLSREETPKIALRVWSYTPRRAIVAVGLLLMMVAVASGILGVVNSTRAETSSATLGNRYLVLQPPVRQVRASAADLQVVFEQFFSGAAISTSLVATASMDSTSIQQNYLTVQHLLSTRDDADLAPGLNAQVSAYTASQTGIAAFLTSGVRPPDSATTAEAERSADKNLDNALGALQATISNRILRANDHARNDARHSRDDLLWCLALGIPFGVAVIALFARKAGRVTRDAAQRDSQQARVTRRNEFEGRLQRALEMAKAEAPAFDMVALALAEAAPGLRSELLLADSSRAHFRRVLSTPPEDDEPGCGVISPGDCPAASSGQTRLYPLSTALDTCPNLKGRACSALCVPVSIGGNSVGVVHVMAPDGSPPTPGVRLDVELVARRASERFAMLRAFELSQTQANSDSLTGLLTRRSLESRIQQFSDDGAPYAVAYGDLDHFKQLNDTFGHSAGDRALRMFSQVLRDALRPIDVACRYGGEEFVIVLPGCPIAEVVPVLERVRQRLGDRLTSGQLPSFTVSFGVASSDQAEDFEGVVALADDALLGAKAAGRNQTVVAHQTPTDNLPGHGQRRQGVPVRTPA